MTLCVKCPQYGFVNRTGTATVGNTDLCSEHLLKSLESEIQKSPDDVARNALLRHLVEECEMLRRTLDDHIERGGHQDQ